jgi:ankyrin repeat protein
MAQNKSKLKDKRKHNKTKQMTEMRTRDKEELQDKLVAAAEEGVKDKDRTRDKEELITAAREGRVDDVSRLLTEFSDDEQVKSETLSRACWDGQWDVVRWMIEHSEVDVNIALTNHYPNTADTVLHCVIWYNKHHWTPLHRACARGDDKEVYRLIYDCGHNINVQNNVGYTPLHWACWYGHSDVIVTLMLAGADETVTNDMRDTPALLAEGRDHKDVLKLLDRDTLMITLNTRKWM